MIAKKLIFLAVTLSLAYQITILPSFGMPNLIDRQIISAGGFHTLLIKPDGTLWAWGSNSYGQIGAPLPGGQSATEAVKVPGDKWVTVSAGKAHSLAIKADGTLWAWGWAEVGQLGIGDTPYKSVSNPVQVGTDNRWVAVSAGGYHSLAIKSDGTLWAWGENTQGQVGIGDVLERIVYSPRQIGTGFRTVSAGGRHSLAIGFKNRLYAWGANGSGQLGSGDNTNVDHPVALWYLEQCRMVSAGEDHTLAITDSGTLWAWGANGSGQLAQPIISSWNTPLQLGTGNNWVTVSAGNESSFAVTGDGNLHAWGKNSDGQLGIGNTINTSNLFQIGLVNAGWNNVCLTVSAGDGHTHAIKADGTLWGWGAALLVGDGTAYSRHSPVQTGSNSRQIEALAGGFHSLAIRSNGTLWAWGRNDYSQIGDSSTTDRNSPVQIGTDNSWRTASSGGFHNLAIKSDGTLWAWGRNNHGQLGDGILWAYRNTPFQVGTDNNWMAVSSGYEHSLAIKSDGTLWTWGANNSGQLGNGTTIEVHYPYNIVTSPYYDYPWCSVSAGNWHSLGWNYDDLNVGWGSNNHGQVGDGTTTERHSPVDVSDIYSEMRFYAGGYHSLAIDDGILWAWGQNNYGQLGDGSTADRHSPVQIFSNVVDASAGGEHSLAVVWDGTLRAWGRNDYGQLGDGTWLTKTTLVQIGSDGKWVKVSGGGYHSLGVKSDGTLWAWGYNNHGQLGVGNNTNQNVPETVQLYPLCSQTCSRCNQDTVVLTDVIFPSGTICECSAAASITVGNGTIVENNAKVLFRSPQVNVQSGAKFESGSSVIIRR